jgi:TPR repeat protein
MDAGSPLASYELARNYMTAKDYDRAIEMWSLGAEKGYPPSMHMLGASYATGWRVPKNRAKARELLEGAADQGHLYAKAKLRCLLMRGGFGFRQRLRGIRLALSIPKDLITICRDPHNEGLR